jgi:hypothetical protein
MLWAGVVEMPGQSLIPQASFYSLHIQGQVIVLSSHWCLCNCPQFAPGGLSRQELFTISPHMEMLKDKWLFWGIICQQEDAAPIRHNKGHVLITICKMLSHHFFSHNSLGIPASALCHYCGFVTICKEKGISNEDNLRTVWTHPHAGGQQTS